MGRGDKRLSTCGGVVIELTDPKCVLLLLRRRGILLNHLVEYIGVLRERDEKHFVVLKAVVI
jgi:hypothetical protein